MMTTDSVERKDLPIATGCLDYFPDAIADIARLSKIGNDKHNPGQPLHWNRPLSSDHADAMMRHFMERGTIDINGVRHSTQVAWRALAILQLEIEQARSAAVVDNPAEFSEVPGEERLVTIQAYDDLHTDYDSIEPTWVASGYYGEGAL